MREIVQEEYFDRVRNCSFENIEIFEPEKEINKKQRIKRHLSILQEK